MSVLPDQGVPARLGERTVQVSAHAIYRYRDRVRPELPLAQAMAELVRAIEQTGVSELTVPRWAFGLAQANKHADEYISVGDKLLLPIEDGGVQTCLVRHEVGATIRWTRGKAA